ncbi:ABC transporter ATP-binding protein [Leptolyngbya sp. 7M]|uniref:ABC transporter ATP-binding protein n=1 Tax=Leptolyngbya sp. 7M TaxID=2812896 RepID=UPI001B8BE41D|nr:ABC transporter ATP-binding protein [Leptolyngbya sp. 7M]QYO67981.1 ABC transporter ATP-binding protein/permease [Leptolyngbya sp. 7M]
MIEFLRRALYVLQGKRKELVILMGLFLFVSFLEAFGTGMIGPFMTLATNPESALENPWLRTIYETLNLSSPSQMIWVTGTAVIALFYLKTFLSFSTQKYIFEFGFNQQAELSCRLMRTYLAAPYTFHLSRNSAILIQNIVNEADRFANGLMMPLLNAVSNVAVICALVILLVITNAAATFTIAGILLISILVYRGTREKFSYLGKEVSESRSEMIRMINQGLGGIKETTVIGCGETFEKRLEEQAMRYGRSVSLAVALQTLPRYIIEAFLITFLILFTFAFILMNQGNSQNLSSVLGIFALASIRLLPAASGLLGVVTNIKYSSYTLDKLYLDLKELEAPDRDLRKHHLIDSKLEKQTLSFQNSITLDNVSYTYPNSQRKSLDNVNLTIRKGESIGLIGRSGAGKTTLVDVILGLLTPEGGDIQVDGNSIYTNLRLWQNIIGYVPQSIFLTDETLERNIAFGVPDHLIDPIKLEKAIQSAQLSELVEQLPDGIKTVVGERGVLLSGGQRQRVGIARALYHEREILVFDEATAALDNETESLVTEAIKSLSGVKTMIIIAHRLSTIKHCTRIYALEKGQVVKSGSYQQVVLAEETASSEV